MNKKKITLATIGLGILGVGVYFYYKKKNKKDKSNKEITPKKPYRDSNPNELFGDIAKTLIISEDYTDEENLFYKVIREFGKYCQSYEWYAEVPSTYEDFLKKLKELSLYEMFVVIIEEKYNKTRN
jgi:LPXTG-motif cell wall-anchored protein